MVPGSCASKAPLALRAVALHAYAYLCRVPGSGDPQTQPAVAMHMQPTSMPALLVQRSTLQKHLRVGGCLSQVRAARQDFMCCRLCACVLSLVKPRPTVPKYPGGIGAGGNGGSAGIVKQKSTTNQTGDFNSGKTYRLHLLLVLPSDGNRALRAWS